MLPPANRWDKGAVGSRFGGERQEQSSLENVGNVAALLEMRSLRIVFQI
jgi:hypothetical protein